LKTSGGDYANMSYVLLLHYLELCEAIEEQNVDAVDNSMFIGSFIHFD